MGEYFKTGNRKPGVCPPIYNPHYVGLHSPLSVSSGCGNFHFSVIDHSMLMESVQRKIEILMYMSLQAEVVVCV